MNAEILSDFTNKVVMYVSIRQDDINEDETKSYLTLSEHKDVWKSKNAVLPLTQIVFPLNSSVFVTRCGGFIWFTTEVNSRLLNKF